MSLPLHLCKMTTKHIHVYLQSNMRMVHKNECMYKNIQYLHLLPSIQTIKNHRFNSRQHKSNSVQNTSKVGRILGLKFKFAK